MICCSCGKEIDINYGREYWNGIYCKKCADEMLSTPEYIKNYKRIIADLQAENAALKERLEKAVELPCKVGDIVYYLQTYCDYKGETVKHCSKRERPIMCDCDEIAHRWSSKDWIYVIREKLFELRDLTRIGKTLFLYREEAEAKIAELRRRCNEKH